MPIDILRYDTGSFSAHNYATLDGDSPYWRELRDGYAAGLARLIAELPAPPEDWGQ
jgi:predicted proteasome-type protease